MPRPPRIQFPGANYHVVTRGNGRQKLFHDQAHYERFTNGLDEEVQRCGWIVLAYCWMPNQIHALIQTPQPNLATGMQHWLSGYANWYAKRNRRTGHLYQGRYKAFLVEDASYYWTLSRYLHLNPCRGSKPLAADPESWPYSSFGGYARMDYVRYRRQGLPVTSAPMESLIKQINLRVKGTEMFWDDPDGAESILHIHAAALSEDGRLYDYLSRRPRWQFLRRTTYPVVAT